MKTKICTKCKKSHPATMEYFCVDKSAKDRLANQCKQCRKLYKQSKKGKVVNNNAQKKYSQSEKGKKEIRKANYKRKFNITLAEYDQMFEQQDGVCKICGRINSNGWRLSIDHSHKTGEIRGLLCHNCNLILGHAKDNVSVLSKAISYLDIKE